MNHATGDALRADARQRALRSRVWKAQHDASCNDGPPHEWVAHLPWDSDEDRLAAEREADAIIAALRP